MSIQEPLLDLNDIQGNIYPGFNKDHQIFKFLALSDDIVAVRLCLNDLIGNIDNSTVVSGFAAVRATIKAQSGGGPSGLTATWMNIGFSFSALAKLTSQQFAAAFAEPVFQVGMAKRSPLLGDPTDPALPGHPSTWTVGNPNANQIEVVITIAADQKEDAVALSAQIDARLAHFLGADGKPAFRAVRPDLAGDILGGDLNGHEHFGFKDGVSQPAIRGRTTNAPDSYVTPRVIDPSSPLAARFGRPGQVLLWPGQFLLGQPRQNGLDPLKPLKPVSLPRDWLQNGSYMVMRVLDQDVPRFWDAMRSYAQQALGKSDDPATDWTAARIVGRWRSGAPVMRTPASDNAAFVADNRIANDFGFSGNAVKPPLVPGQPPLPDLPLQQADPDGKVCPFGAHIRKVNPRDDSVELGSSSDSLRRLIVRRGIPFGPPLANPMHPTPADSQESRGLIFVSYQASIEQQFEFLMQNWVNGQDAPHVGGGRDAVLGRHTGVLQSDIHVVDPAGNDHTIPQMTDFITARGGGYFFAPSLKGLRALASGDIN